MKKKKILYVHHSGGLGGAPRSLALLINELKVIDQNADLKLLCIYKGPILEYFKKNHIEFALNERIYPFHGSTVVEPSLVVFLVNLLGAPLSFFNAYMFIKRENPKIVHLNSSCLFVTAIAAKFVNKRIKVICHVREPLRKSIFGKIIRQMCYKYVDKFIAIDTFTGSTMLHKNNLEIIYNSVDFASYNSDVKSNILRKELQLEDDTIIFLYLARIAEGNGTIDLIKAAGVINNINEKVHFVIAGYDPSVTNSYSQKVFNEAKGNENIHFLNFREDVPELIASSDVMVIPFTEPHFARSVIEASSMGKPSIGANIGGVEEVISHGKSGFLYNNIEELVQYSLLLAQSENLRIELGRSAESYARIQFDVRTSSKRIAEIYDKISE